MASSRTYSNYENPHTTAEFSRPIWDQGLSSSVAGASNKKIFPNEEYKEAQTSQPRLPTEPAEKPTDPKELLNKIKDILIMVFCNIYNINIALKKNNNKTFLLVRIDQSHISVLKNYDFKDNNIATVQISNIRVFLSQSEKAKKIFEGNNPRETHHLIQAATLSNTKQAASIQQELKEIDRVMGGASFKKDTMIPTPQYSAQSRPGGAPIFRDNSQWGSIVPPPVQVQAHKSQTFTPVPSEGHAPVFPNVMWNSDPGHPGQNFSKSLEGELKKTLAQQGTDLLLLELKNDIILKTETRPSAGKGIQFQVKVEINEINVKIDSEILIHIFEYYNEIQRIYYMRLIRFAQYLQDEYETMKFQAEKNIVGFQRPPRGSFSVRGSQLPQGNIYSKDHLDRSYHEKSHISVDSRRQVEDKGYMARSQIYGTGAAGSGFGSEQNFQPLSPTQDLDQTEIFMNKLSEFLEFNEFLVSLNFDGLNLTLAENSHTLDNRADLLNLQLPKGKINVSFNFNKKNAYIVDVYGFRLETSSKFKALHFLFKKVKALIDSGMDDEIERTTFFSEFLVKKGILKEQVDSRILRDHYSKQHHY